MREGQVFAEEAIKICQIDVEFHSLGWKPTDFNFGVYFGDLLTQTKYLPIAAGNFFDHRKITLVLAGDPLCEKVFNFQNLFRINDQSI